jgi:broad specificity phosphatase PhoE
MTRLHLVRHGQTDWNLEGRWQGQADVALNDVGREQAQQSAQKLRSISLAAIYSSDLIRAAETARAIARVNPAPLVLEPRLREIHQGEWQGLLVGEIQARYAEAFQQSRANPLTMAAPGGETTQQVGERALAAVRDLAAKHPQGNVAVVSHGYILAVLLTHFRKIPFERVWEQIPQNGEIIVLEIEPGQVDLGSLS